MPRLFVSRAGFVCGCGHTGTTLVARILAQHPEVTCPEFETCAFFSSEGIALLDELIAGLDGLLVEKTPKHIRRMSVIRAHLPGAKFILTVRDGRHVAASFVRRCGSAEAGAERWIKDSGIVMAESDKDDVIVCRYEDLIAEPEAEVRRICVFLGLDYESSMLDYHKTPSQWFGVEPDPEGTHEQRRAWQVNQPIFDGRGDSVSVPILETGDGQRVMEFFGYS